MAETHLCPCGKPLAEPLQRVGNARALCACGQVARLDPAAQAAYAERAPGEDTTPSPDEPPRAAAPDADHTGAEREDLAPAGGRSEPSAPAGAPADWSEAERNAPAQLPKVDDDPPVEPETLAPPPPRPAPDFGGLFS